jgi:phosphoribosylanthranilate isomerase
MNGAERNTVKIAAKICGLSTSVTMAAALDAGADYVGLVLFPKSPRNVDFKLAEALADQARGRSRVVALAVDPGPALLSVIALDIRPDAIQLHGHESPEDVAFVRSTLTKWGLPECQVWKAVAVSDPADLHRALAYRDITDLIVFDAKPPRDATLPGGNGRAFDWQLLADGGVDYPYMLSGGLTAENVAQAITITGARSVDVSSGVESAPGIKDPELIRRFLLAVNGSTTTP